VAARLDQIRPAGFHRMMLRRAEAGGLDLAFDRKPGQRLRWTGFYSVRFLKTAGLRTVKAVLSCPTFHLCLDWSLTPRQAEALRILVVSAVSPEGWIKPWTRSEEARRILWLWVGLGVVAADAAASTGNRE
jgi:hypothetical protein